MSAPRIGSIKLGTRVVVSWYDAWGDEKQMEPEEWQDSMKVETVGTLERDTPLLVTVASERFPDDPGHFRGATHIPRGIIESIDVLVPKEAE